MMFVLLLFWQNGFFIRSVCINLSQSLIICFYALLQLCVFSANTYPQSKVGLVSTCAALPFEVGVTCLEFPALFLRVFPLSGLSG